MKLFINLIKLKHSLNIEKRKKALKIIDSHKIAFADIKKVLINNIRLRSCTLEALSVSWPLESEVLSEVVLDGWNDGLDWKWNEGYIFSDNQPLY